MMMPVLRSRFWMFRNYTKQDISWYHCGYMQFGQENTENAQDVQTIEHLKELILTDEQYREHPFATTESERAYLLELKKGDKQLVYFGSPHIYDPEDPLFEEIQRKFVEFKPEIVYVEGREFINTQKDKVREVLGKESLESVKLDGESHYVLKLAVDAEIDFESPEPDFSKEIAALLEKGYVKKDIFTFYMYRVIDQYQRLHGEKSIEGCKKHLGNSFRQFRKESGWEAEELDKFESELVSELDIEDRKKYRRQVDPIPWEGNPQSVINEISRQSSSFRDRFILERITEGLKKYSRVFVIYGSAHAVKQEPALRSLFGE